MSKAFETKIDIISRLFWSY